jgi:hypothetical protein
MRGLLIATLSAIVTLTACVQPQAHSPVAAPTSATPTGATSPSEEPRTAVEHPIPAATPESPVAANTSTPPAAAPPAAPPAAAPAAPPPAAAPPAAARAAPPAPPQANAPAAQSDQPPTARRPVTATPSVPEESSPPAKPPVAVATPVEALASQTLDLAGLEQRLRDTDAIGVFTKLSLKNQVDDLLAQFRGFYRGEIKVPLADLRQRYELLLLKVVTLLQDADQQLANAINSSREAIWGILADPQKFSQI